MNDTIRELVQQYGWQVALRQTELEAWKFAGAAVVTMFLTALIIRLERKQIKPVDPIAYQFIALLTIVLGGGIATALGIEAIFRVANPIWYAIEKLIGG